MTTSPNAAIRRDPRQTPDDMDEFGRDEVSSWRRVGVTRKHVNESSRILDEVEALRVRRERQREQRDLVRS